MDFDLYFEPVDFSQFECAAWAQKKLTLGYLLEKNQERIKPEKADILLFGVEEDRNSIAPGAAEAPYLIRKHLYSLNRIASRFKILDLGNLKLGNTPNDTYFALKDVCEQLLEMGKRVIVLGGSQDLTFGMAKSFEISKFSMVSVDPKLDFKKGAKSINSETFLSFIIEKRRNLQSHTTLGYQSYFTDALELDQFNQMLCEGKRLGSVRYDLTSVEPILRCTDLFSFDINAVRSQDAPGQYFSSPNGLYAEEACQIARYAGMSDQLSLAGFFNVIPKNDINEQTSHLTAQVIWHLLEGFYHRVPENPEKISDDFNQFLVDIEGVDLPLIFYQSKKTNRWWMEIYDPEDESQTVIPCSEDDYMHATRNEIPDRWWKSIRKLGKR